MARRILRRFLPDPERIRANPTLQRFAHWLAAPGVWYLNRRSVAGGAAVGLFMAFVPMPLQMVPATALSILFRVHLPTAIAGVWVTNPVTLGPLYYFCYVVGAWALGTPASVTVFDPSWAWFASEFGRIGAPFLLGCLIVSSVSALLGYFGLHLMWRLVVTRAWTRRQTTRRLRRLG